MHRDDYTPAQVKVSRRQTQAHINRQILFKTERYTDIDVTSLRSCVWVWAADADSSSSQVHSFRTNSHPPTQHSTYQIRNQNKRAKQIYRRSTNINITREQTHTHNHIFTNIHFKRTQHNTTRTFGSGTLTLLFFVLCSTGTIRCKKK